VRIAITNRQDVCKLNATATKKLVMFFAKKLQSLNPNITFGDISLVTINDTGIQTINQMQFGRNEPTDVISFRYNPIPGDRGRHTGEIIVNVQRALEVSRKRQHWNAAKELALYIAHGCDHLSGEDDDTEDGYARMRRRELRWLKDAENARLFSSPLLSRTPTHRKKTGRCND
jgi:rRNA maturation RNase YbeY